VFVEPFPPTGEKHQARKTFIDFHPNWSQDGMRTFYYLWSGLPFVVGPITTGPASAFGIPIDTTLL
jgi:hypothetical protein